MESKDEDSYKFAHWNRLNTSGSIHRLGKTEKWLGAAISKESIADEDKARAIRRRDQGATSKQHTEKDVGVQ